MQFGPVYDALFEHNHHTIGTIYDYSNSKNYANARFMANLFARYDR